MERLGLAACLMRSVTLWGLAAVKYCPFHGQVAAGMVVYEAPLSGRATTPGAGSPHTRKCGIGQLPHALQAVLGSTGISLRCTGR